MAAGCCESICMHSEAKTFGRQRPGVKKGSKEATSLQETHQGQTEILQEFKYWTAEDWCKVIFSNEAPFRLFGTSGKSIIRRRKGERYHESYVVPTVRHPETIYVWGCFSTKGVGSLIILPKNTAMNKEWHQNILQERLLPTIHEQFGDDLCIFQHDGAPCHKSRVIKKWFKDHYIEILDL
ncbi:hypothetical protein cypCar_00031453 [Cyprinus carpio]|nr:hypothetical protein cypCar_00031453 [Cyprinus carpio]